MSILRSVCHHYIWKRFVLITRITWTFEISRYFMIRPFRGNDANGVFHAGEGLEAGFNGILCMSRFWEMGKSLAGAML